ncbi:MAG: hypothetical protein K5633_04220 [Paludibacteraceae bacterium]|nr:hypothetical protein [Paludibacteraceae bacterium]
MLEIIGVSITSIAIATVTIVIVWRMTKAERERRTFDLKRENVKVMTPVRLRAYERMAIFVERIAPDSLVMRQRFGERTTSSQLQRTLLDQIRQEWEHNAAQQIYISEETWAQLVNAKESIVELVNSCAMQLDPKTVSVGLANLVLNTYNEEKSKQDTPIQMALAAIKKDVSAF